MAENKVRPKLTSAQIDAKYIAMGEKMAGGVPDKEDAEALAEANDGKFGRPYVYSDPKIVHLAQIHVYAHAGWRRVEGWSRFVYGRDGTPDHTTLCRRANAMDMDIEPGVAVLCNYGKTLILAVDSTGLGMTKANGWRQEKHGGQRGYLSLHTVTHEKTGRVGASKLEAPEEGDAPHFMDLVETSLKDAGMDPEKRKEEIRRRRADLAAGKAIILSRNDGVADTSTEAAAKVAVAVEKVLSECEVEGAEVEGAEVEGAEVEGAEVEVEGAENRGAEGTGTRGDDNGTAKSASMLTTMARRYAADMHDSAVPILAAAAMRHTPTPEVTGNSVQKTPKSGNDQQAKPQQQPQQQSPPGSSAGTEDENTAHARSLVAASSLSATESILDALGLSPGGDDLGNDWIKIVVRGDAAYDAHKIFKFCYDFGIDPCFRIRRNANLRSRGKGKARPRAVIDQLGGGNPDPKVFYALSKGAKHMYQRAWKIIAQYGRRWLHEAGFGSFKALMGGSIMAVKPANMSKEVILKVNLYNQLQIVGAEAAANA